MDEPLLNFDFAETFPARMWVSHWARDGQYPDGYRYKILSALHKTENVIELLIVHEQRSGDKEVFEQLTIRPEAIERIGRRFAAKLAEQFGLDFQEQDFTHRRSRFPFP